MSILCGRNTDAAIVCRYCGRDLPAIDALTSQQPKDNLTKKQASVWLQGLKASILITILYFFNNAILKPPSADRFQGNIVLGLLTTFLGWWVVCAGILWLWRTLGVKVFLFILILGSLGLFAYLNGNGSFTLTMPTPTSTATRTPFPTRTPTPRKGSIQSVVLTYQASLEKSCIQASEIDASFTGEEVCVTGIVSSAGNTNIGEGGQYRIHFLNSPNGFFLLDVNYEYPDVKVGDCVTASGTVNTDMGGFPYINLRGQLFGCK
jgi:hypothetical protein